MASVPNVVPSQLPTVDELRDWGDAHDSSAVNALYEWAGRRQRPFRWNEWQQGYRMIRLAMERSSDALSSSNVTVTAKWNEVMTGIHGVDWRRVLNAHGGRDSQVRFVRDPPLPPAGQQSQVTSREFALRESADAQGGDRRAASEPG